MTPKKISELYEAVLVREADGAELRMSIATESLEDAKYEAETRARAEPDTRYAVKSVKKA